MQHTIVDDPEAEKPLMPRSHLLNALESIRDALTSESLEVGSVDLCYGMLVMAKDDVTAAVAAMKKHRESVIQFRGFDQLEMQLESGTVTATIRYVAADERVPAAV